VRPRHIPDVLRIGGPTVGVLPAGPAPMRALETRPRPARVPPETRPRPADGDCNSSYNVALIVQQSQERLFIRQWIRRFGRRVAR